MDLDLYPCKVIKEPFPLIPGRGHPCDFINIIACKQMSYNYQLAGKMNHSGGCFVVIEPSFLKTSTLLIG